jgi:glutathione S-transferase
MTGKYKLYGREGSGSSVCEAMLELTGLPYEIIDLKRWEKDAAPAELLALNPLGQIPALILPGGGVMTESAAITLFLADLAPSASLAPTLNDSHRARYLRWMAYLAANSYMTARRFYYPERYSANPSGAAGIKAAAIKQWDQEWLTFSHALAHGPYILGGQMCAADLYAAMLISWDLDIEALLKRHPNLKVLYDGVVSHPRLAEIWKRHGV